jgi:hypothetical protein
MLYITESGGIREDLQVDDVRFDLKYWQQIARNVVGSQGKAFAVVKNPINNEYFVRSLESAKTFKNEIVWSSDQPEIKIEPVPLDIPSGLLITYMIAGGGLHCELD